MAIVDNRTPRPKGAKSLAQGNALCRQDTTTNHPSPEGA